MGSGWQEVRTKRSFWVHQKQPEWRQAMLRVLFHSAIRMHSILSSKSLLFQSLQSGKLRHILGGGGLDSALDNPMI